MTWREKLPLPEIDDRNDEKPISVTSVTASSAGPIFESRVSDKSVPELLDPERSDFVRARRILNAAGVRIIDIGRIVIGVWSDLDGPEIRRALLALRHADSPVCYLDGAQVPDRYKLREVPGAPVPMDVLVEMARNQTAPWVARDHATPPSQWETFRV